ncbi:MAG: M48 family metallopeptidase [Gemmatimonadota bacterium]|nr:M48 family metallopeptidase [Gemmatimonadota bacterium]
MRTHEERRAALCERVDDWASRLNVQQPRVRIQRMSRKWGSCSTSGTLTLASDLADREAGFQDFVIAHELLHLRVPNHGKLFKALMTAHVPNWKRYDAARRHAPARVSIARSSVSGAEES